MGEAASVLFVGTSAEEPVQLSGPPRRVAGLVRLRNLQAPTLVLRNAALLDRSGRLADMPTRHGFAPVVLPPAEDRAVPLAIELDPTTPPGEYQVDLDVMGQVHPAVLHVVECVAVRVEPKVVVVIDEPGQRHRTRLVVTNEGNVPLTIGAIEDVELRDDVVEVRDLRGVIGPLLSEVPENLEDVAAVLVAVLRPRGSVVARLAVRTLGAPVALPPGRTATIDLEIDRPSGLVANGRYRGRVAILTADLEFVVVSAGPGHHEQPHTTARQAPSGAHRPTGDPSGSRKKEGGRK